MRPLKWILIAAAGLVALLLAGVLVVTQWVDPDVFKPRIVAALRDATGRPVELPGELELAWYPWLALRTGAGSLGNPPGIAGAPLARWREARLGARLLPLLRGEFELDRLRFDGLEVELRRDAAGRDNWSGLLDAAGGGGDSRPLRLARAQPPACAGTWCMPIRAWKRLSSATCANASSVRACRPSSAASWFPPKRWSS